MLRHVILIAGNVKKKRGVAESEYFSPPFPFWLLFWLPFPSQGLKRIVCSHCLHFLASDHFSACCVCLWIPLDNCLSRAGNGLVFIIPDGQVLVLFSFDLSQTLHTHSLFEILPPPEFPTPYYTGFLFPLGSSFWVSTHP